MPFLFISKKARAKKVAPMSRKKVWKPGDIFSAVTGKSIGECATIDEVDAAVKAALHLSGPLKFDGNDSGFVIRNGDVFPHVDASIDSNLDQRVDATIVSR